MHWIACVQPAFDPACRQTGRRAERVAGFGVHDPVWILMRIREGAGYCLFEILGMDTAILGHHAVNAVVFGCHAVESAILRRYLAKDAALRCHDAICGMLVLHRSDPEKNDHVCLKILRPNSPPKGTVLKSAGIALMDRIRHLLQAVMKNNAYDPE